MRFTLKCQIGENKKRNEKCLLLSKIINSHVCGNFMKYSACQIGKSMGLNKACGEVELVGLPLFAQQCKYWTSIGNGHMVRSRHLGKITNCLVLILN